MSGRGLFSMDSDSDNDSDNDIDGEFNNNNDKLQQLENNMIFKLNDKIFFTIKRMDNIYVVFESNEKLLPTKENKIAYLRSSNLSPNKNFMELTVTDFKHVYDYSDNNKFLVYLIKRELITKINNNNDDLCGINDKTIFELFQRIKGIQLVNDVLVKIN